MAVVDRNGVSIIGVFVVVLFPKGNFICLVSVSSILTDAVKAVPVSLRNDSIRLIPN